MLSFASELRYAVRQVTKNPGYSVVVILTLALAIGANTAIFSVVDAMLLRPLPYPHSERLGALMRNVAGKTVLNFPSGIDRDSWLFLRDNVPAVTAAVASGAGGVNLEAAGHAQYVHGQRVSARYFEVLGLHPVLGRGFTSVEDSAGGANVVVLSWGLWKSTFGGDPTILGKAIRLKDVPYTVVGVLPQGARTPAAAELWTPLRPETTREGEGNNFDAVLRLKDDATWQQANAQLKRLQSLTTRIVSRKYPNLETFYSTAPLQQSLATDARTPVMVLMAAVGFVLLIACANLAGLALVRVGRRENEIATRLALGATRWAILRQFWMESLLLTLAGGAAAIWLGKLLLERMNHDIPQALLPIGGVALDARILSFTVLIAMGSSLFFGLLPALTIRRIDVGSALASAGNRTLAASGATHTRYVLIAGEVALTVVLLTVAGLLVRTLVYLRTVPPGFNPDHVVVAQASLDEARYEEQARFLQLVNASLEQLKKIPGVTSAAVGLSAPYERALNDNVRIADGPQTGLNQMTNLVYVTPDYFKVLQMPLRAGRTFSDSDTSSSRPVAVVNRAFAKSYLGREDGVGRHLDNNIEIVGVVENVSAPRGFSQGYEPIALEPTMYIPATQVPVALLNLAHLWFQPNWMVRTRGNTSTTAQQMQRAISAADPDLPVSSVHTIGDVLTESLLLQRMQAGLLAGLAGLALLLSCVGIYGLVSSLVQQRTRELGIRLALGCSVHEAMLEISRAGITATAVGLASGFLLTSLAVRVLRNQLFGVRLYDPLTLGIVTVVLAVVALAAALLPAARIARIDPAETLRAQ